MIFPNPQANTWYWKQQKQTYKWIIDQTSVASYRVIIVNSFFCSKLDAPLELIEKQSTLFPSTELDSQSDQIIYEME